MQSLSGPALSLPDLSYNKKAMKVQLPMKVHGNKTINDVLSVPLPAQFFESFDIPNSELSNNHMRSVILSSSFLLMKEVRLREIQNLPEVCSPDMNNRIVTPESMLSQPQHYSTFCGLSTRGVIQRKTKNKLRGMIFQGRLFKCILFLSFCFHNNPKMFRIAMVPNNFYLTDRYCVYKLYA